jgi:hypothetical protein
MVLGFRLGIAKPRDVEIVVASVYFLTRETTETAFFVLILTLRFAERITAEGLLKIGKVRDDEWSGLAEGFHLIAQVVDPNRLSVGLVGLAAREKQHVSFDALRIENLRREAKDCMQVAQLHHPRAQSPAGVILKQDVVGYNDCSTTAKLQGADDVFDEGELFIRRVGSDRKIGTVWSSATLLCAKGRIGENEVRRRKRLAVRRQRVARFNALFDAMEHEVHQAKAMRIRHQFEADKGVVFLKKDLVLGQFEEVVCAVPDVAVGRDDKTAGARRRVLNDLALSIFAEI